MFNTFKLSWRLENTYRTNAVINSFKSIPLVGKFFPANEFYKIAPFKVLGGIISVFWEIGTTFFGKLLYTLVIMGVAGILSEFSKTPVAELYVHIFILLTVLGTFLNNQLFDTDTICYYSVNILGINARKYILSHYIYWLIRMFVGTLPFTLITGLALDVPIGIALTLPLFTVLAKLSEAFICLKYNEAIDEYSDHNLPVAFNIIACILLSAATVVLPCLGYTIPLFAYYPILGVLGTFSILAVVKLVTFKKYSSAYRQILNNAMHNTAKVKTSTAETTKENNRKLISLNKDITSDKYGFEYLNDLFVKRHRKVLWQPILIITAAVVILSVATIVFYYIFPEMHETMKGLSIDILPLFAFVMYLINRGTSYTQALFINCDHSMLTFSFYKKPKSILKLFTIRLRELTKLNLVPSVAISIGLMAVLFVTDGFEQPLYFVLIPLTIISMGIFFSVHYLTIYYLLQPYTANTEIKSAAFQFVTGATYFFCYMLIQIDVNSFWFAVIMTTFCIAYCIGACFLVYKYAAKTFKIRA